MTGMKGFERSLSWPSSRYHAGIHLETPRQITETSRQPVIWHRFETGTLWIYHVQ